MTKLSKSDTKTVQNIAFYLKDGNRQSASQVASFFIRSAPSASVEAKRIAALKEIGVVFA